MFPLYVSFIGCQLLRVGTRFSLLCPQRGAQWLVCGDLLHTVMGCMRWSELGPSLAQGADRSYWPSINTGPGRATHVTLLCFPSSPHQPSLLGLNVISFFFFFFFFFFFYLWWILTYIEMKQPRVYMCSPSQSPLPPPSPPIPSRFSQCTRSAHLSHASNLGW